MKLSSALLVLVASSQFVLGDVRASPAPRSPPSVAHSFAELPRMKGPPGQVLELDLGGGVTERYEYDAEGRLVVFSVDAPGETNDLRETYAYSWDGMLTRRVLDAAGENEDIEESYAYDERGRLTMLLRSLPGLAPYFVEFYDWDAEGRIVYWAHAPGQSEEDGFAERYAYNPSGKLTQWERDEYGVRNDVTERYLYDANGCLLSVERDAWGSENDSLETYECPGR